MCAAERTPRPPRAAHQPRGTLRFGTIVIIGGGCYGSYYLRQLGRAAAAGAAGWDRVLVVDRDPACRAAGEIASVAGPKVELVTSAWDVFLGEFLAAAAARPPAVPGEVPDAIVPSPLMPHLLYEWVIERARSRWPARRVEEGTLGGPLPVPWQRDAAAGGTRYVSFAEWMCPVNCIEPARCPVTRGERTWSLPPTVREFVDAERARGRPLVGPYVFRCVHRCYGVGMIDVAEVTAADDAISGAAASSPVEVLVGTVSHCHGALGVVAIGA